MPFCCCYTLAQQLTFGMSKSITLHSPSFNASTEEWTTWLEDLRDLPPSGEVSKAIKKAQEFLAKRRAHEKRSNRESRLDLCLA